MVRARDERSPQLADLGPRTLSSTAEQAGDAYRRTDRLILNLVWSPIPSVDMGAELLWGQRENKDGSTGTAQPAPAPRTIPVLGACRGNGKVRAQGACRVKARREEAGDAGASWPTSNAASTRQPPCALRVTGGVGPSAVLSRLADGPASPSARRLASGPTAPITRAFRFPRQAPRAGSRRPLARDTVLGRAEEDAWPRVRLSPTPLLPDKPHHRHACCKPRRHGQRRGEGLGHAGTQGY